jgi:hypothetical protein
MASDAEGAGRPRLPVPSSRGGLWVRMLRSLGLGPRLVALRWGSLWSAGHRKPSFIHHSSLSCGGLGAQHRGRPRTTTGKEPSAACALSFALAHRLSQSPRASSSTEGRFGATSSYQPVDSCWALELRAHRRMWRDNLRAVLAAPEQQRPVQSAHPVADELRDAALDRTRDARREPELSLRTPSSCCRLF